MKIRSPRTLTETTNLAGSATNKVSRTMYKCSLPSYPEFSWGLQTHAPQCGSCVGVQRWSQPSPRCRLDWVYGWCGPAESGCFHRRQSTKQLPYNNTKRKNRWFRSCASFFSFLTSTSWAHIYHMSTHLSHTLWEGKKHNSLLTLQWHICLPTEHSWSH